MNCKPGDLAVIVRSNLGNFGKIVRVLRPSPGNGMPAGSKYEVGGIRWRVAADGKFRWLVEAQGADLKDSNGEMCRVCPATDSQLRPLRDPGYDAQDETLDWLPVPHKETA